MHQYPRPLAQIHADELAQLPPEELAKLRYEWDLWCLPHQQEPDWERYDTWLQVGGRGSGKNTGVCSWIRREVTDNGVRRINLIGRTSASVRDDMVCGEAGIIQAFPPHQRPVYISSQSLVRFHTGATALMLSAEEPESIQGKNAELAWCDEFSTYVRPEEVWSQVVLSTRVGRPKKAITSNWMPPCPFLESMVDDAERRRVCVVEASSFDNFANLPAPVQHEIQEMMLTEVEHVTMSEMSFRSTPIWEC
jgi:phage terminase large subunit-like protein